MNNIVKYTNNIEDYQIICISGSLPKGLTSEFYSELVYIAKEKGKKVVVDTSGKALEEIFASKPYMVKPNNDEIAALMEQEIK